MCCLFYFGSFVCFHSCAKETMSIASAIFIFPPYSKPSEAAPPPHHHSSSTVCYYYCYWASTTKTMYSDLRKRQKHVVWRPRAARERKRPIFGGTRQQQGLVRELLSDGGGSSGDDSLHVRPRPRVQSFDSSWEGGRKMRAPFSRSRSLALSLLSSHHRCKRVAFAVLPSLPPTYVSWTRPALRGGGSIARSRPRPPQIPTPPPEVEKPK